MVLDMENHMDLVLEIGAGRDLDVAIMDLKMALGMKSEKVTDRRKKMNSKTVHTINNIIVDKYTSIYYK